MEHFSSKMAGETPEVRSDQRYPKDIPKSNCDWSTVLILFKRLRVTLVTV